MKIAILLLVILWGLGDDLSVKLVGRPTSGTLSLGAMAVIGRDDYDWGIVESPLYPPSNPRFQISGVSVAVSDTPCRMIMIHRGYVWFEVPAGLPINRGARPSYHLVEVRKGATIVFSKPIRVFPASPEFMYWNNDVSRGPSGIWQYQYGQVDFLSVDRPVLIGSGGAVIRMSGNGFGVDGQLLRVNVGSRSLEAIVGNDVVLPIQHLYIRLPLDLQDGPHVVWMSCRGDACPERGFPTISTLRVQDIRTGPPGGDNIK